MALWLPGGFCVEHCGNHLLPDPFQKKKVAVRKMKKAIFIITTVFIMLITSRFVIRIVDATVQIDNDIALLIILLIVLNVVIGMLSRFLYKKIFRGKS